MAMGWLDVADGLAVTPLPGSGKCGATRAPRGDLCGWRIAVGLKARRRPLDRDSVRSQVERHPRPGA